MKINAKVQYGLKALIDIAGTQESVSAMQKEIAERQEIPLKYLDAIITGLKNNGLIVNKAGKGSGYRLARNPDQISVYDVYRSFEADLALVNCSSLSMEGIPQDSCPAEDYWFELNNKIKQLMINTTLAQLMHENSKSI
jgi:Rrf2 family protein